MKRILSIAAALAATVALLAGCSALKNVANNAGINTGSLLNGGIKTYTFYNLPEKSPPRAHGAIAQNGGVFQMARAPWIAYLDDDDEYHPDFLQRMFAAGEKHPECPLVYCRATFRYLHSGRRIWGNPFHGALRFSRERLAHYNFLVSNGVLHQRALLDEVGGWNPGDYFDDYDLWKRMAEKHDFYFVNEALCTVYTEAPPFFTRLFTKGVKILLHGRRLEDQG